MINLDKIDKVYLHIPPADMRKAVNGLSIIIETDMGLEITDNTLYVFCNKGHNMLKILHYDHGFDANANEPYTVNKVPIFHSDTMPNLIKRMHIPIGIITVPKKHAQQVCDRLVKSGIKAIWNFAPINLDVPKDVYVHNENMAESLALIANKIKDGN